MIVYIDQIFAVNFFTDFILLHVASGFMGNRRLIFTLIASLAGSVYSVLLYIPGADFICHPILKIVVFVSMIVICTRPKKIRMLVRNVLLFSAVVMFFGGGVFGLLLLSGYTVADIMNNTIFVFNAGTPVLMLAFSVVLMFGYSGIVVLYKAVRLKGKTARVEIRHRGKRAIFYGLVDTGCTLCEPRRDRPVIIVYGKYADRFLKESGEVFMIPYSTVDNSGAFLGFYPDFVKVRNRVVNNVAVAVCYGEFMKEREYKAIINSDILKEESCFA